METNHFSKKKRRAFKLLLIFGGMLLGLLAAEISLRIVGYSYPEFYRPDEQTGYALMPKTSGWYQKEGKSFVEINSDGLRDVEHLISKPANTIRIAILGDSYAEALQVGLEDAFWRILQTKLQECGAFDGKQVEVINFGVSGYGTAQEYLTLKEKVWKYSPDLVILAVTTNNDITDNSRHFKKTEIPYFVYQDDKLTLDDSFREAASFKFKNSVLSRIGQWFKNNFRVIQAINEIQVVLKYRFEEWKNQPRTSAPTRLSFRALAAEKASDAPMNLSDIGIDNQIYRAPNDEHWKDAWRVTEGLIALINEDAAAKNAKLLVVTLSNAPQVHPNPAARAAFIIQRSSEDLFYPDKRIKSFCEMRKIPIVTLAPDLQSYAERHNIYLHGFDKNIGNGHWNSSGHKIAGEILSEKMCAGILK